MTKTAVELLRETAQELRAARVPDVVIPDCDEDERYPLGIEPGTYPLPEVVEAVQFLADMLEE